MAHDFFRLLEFLSYFFIHFNRVFLYLSKSVKMNLISPTIVGEANERSVVSVKEVTKKSDG